QRGVEDETLIELLGRMEDGVGEGHHPGEGVKQILATLAAARDLVSLPRARELAARFTQRGDQRLERGIAEVAGADGAELGDEHARAALPVGEHLAPCRVGEREPRVVARRARNRAEVAEQRDGGVVPGQVIPAAPDDVGRIGPEVLNQAAQRRRDALDGALAWWRLLATPEHYQVAALGLVEAQSARE